MIEIAEVRRQGLGGAGRRQIARRVGLDPKTVRRQSAADAERPHGAVFFPLLDEQGRRYDNHSTPGREKVGLDTPFVPDWGYAN